jgi:hypothetical protein
VMLRTSWGACQLEHRWLYTVSALIVFSVFRYLSVGRTESAQSFGKEECVFQETYSMMFGPQIYNFITIMQYSASQVNDNSTSERFT